MEIENHDGLWSVVVNLEIGSGIKVVAYADTETSALHQARMRIVSIRNAFLAVGMNGWHGTLNGFDALLHEAIVEADKRLVAA